MGVDVQVARGKAFERHLGTLSAPQAREQFPVKNESKRPDFEWLGQQFGLFDRRKEQNPIELQLRVRPAVGIRLSCRRDVLHARGDFARRVQRPSIVRLQHLFENRSAATREGIPSCGMTHTTAVLSFTRARKHPGASQRDSRSP
jgi:hypothetical protein